jgi:hypothetical protein
MTMLDHLTAYRVTRPARALVLVPLPDIVPWQVAMMAALRAQAATWGGAANLVVPWTDELLERPELWAIATALDPDLIVVARLNGAELAGVVPDGDPLLATDDALTRIDPTAHKRVLELLAARLPILQRNGAGRRLFCDASGTRFPATPIIAVGGELGPGVALRCSGDLDLGLMLAAEAGDVADVVVTTLAQRGVVVAPHDLAPADARDRVLRGQQVPGAGGAWAIAETGLQWLFPVIQNAPVSVVVGDDPWDFAIAYALRRSTGLAWWLPTSVLQDPFTVPWLVHRIEQVGQLVERAVVVSGSDRGAAARLLEEIAGSGSNQHEWSLPEDPLAPLHEQSARLLTRAPGLESFALHDGATGYLPPVLPEVEEASGERIYWMAEVLGANWQPLPDARLAEHIVLQPGYGSTNARPTRAGAAYLCPHYMRTSPDMRSEIVRPRIAALSLRAQLATILEGSGWRLEPSDKGQYAEGAANLFGGDDALRAALSAPCWWGALTALRTSVARNTGAGARGWKIGDRTYYSLDEVETIRTETALNADVEDLLERRILMRGLVFRCPLCRFKAWYGADELAGALRCSRCREPFALTDRGWIPEPEPQWRYRLNEMLWQLLSHNGDVPLRALRETLGIGTPELREPATALHEHDLWAPGAETPIELDICAQVGPALWIGEAKVVSNLGPQQEAREKLGRLRDAAGILNPHGILFVTASHGWSEATRTLAEVELGRLPVELRFERCARPV